MSDLLKLWEHYNQPVIDFTLDLEKDYHYHFIRKKRNEACSCIRIYQKVDGWHAELSYFVGVDWISKTKAVYVAPKLTEGPNQTNYLEMLFSALKHPEIATHTEDLFEIKWDKEQIKISQQEDLLTPLLVVQYLQVVKEIVRKGLKKSYYKVEQNLYGKVKGKILVGQTIKQNLLKNKKLNTFCSFDEFGYNNPENRLLKKALTFVQRYLPTLRHLQAEKFTTEMFNYINPAFGFVSDDVDINLVKHSKFNVFYKEYSEALKLAKLILKRFGYNITNTQHQTSIKTPPFWIDMSKLFELYVLGLLKDRFGNKVDYHVTSYWNELDYLLKEEDMSMVIDAKYKRYDEKRVSNDDIRQVSGYARLKSVYAQLGKPENEIIDCLIIYPDQKDGLDNFYSVNFKEEKNQIEEFVQVYKVGVKLPLIKA